MFCCGKGVKNRLRSDSEEASPQNRMHPSILRVSSREGDALIEEHGEVPPF
jgi:hypothetical protein